MRSGLVRAEVARPRPARRRRAPVSSNRRRQPPSAAWHWIDLSRAGRRDRGERGDADRRCTQQHLQRGANRPRSRGRSMRPGLRRSSLHDAALSGLPDAPATRSHCTPKPSPSTSRDTRRRGHRGHEGGPRRVGVAAPDAFGRAAAAAQSLFQKCLKSAGRCVVRRASSLSADDVGATLRRSEVAGVRATALHFAHARTWCWRSRLSSHGPALGRMSFVRLPASGTGSFAKSLERPSDIEGAVFTGMDVRQGEWSADSRSRHRREAGVQASDRRRAPDAADPAHVGRDLHRPRLFRATSSSRAIRTAIRALLDAAFAGDFDDDDWAHALGGTHALVEADGAVVAHASVVPRVLDVRHAARAGRLRRSGRRAAGAARHRARHRGDARASARSSRVSSSWARSRPANGASTRASGGNAGEGRRGCAIRTAGSNARLTMTTA